MIYIQIKFINSYWIMFLNINIMSSYLIYWFYWCETTSPVAVMVVFPRSQWLGGTGELRDAVYKGVKNWRVISFCLTALTPTPHPAFPTTRAQRLPTSEEPSPTSRQPSPKKTPSKWPAILQPPRVMDFVRWHMPNINHYCMFFILYIFLYIKWRKWMLLPGIGLIL